MVQPITYTRRMKFGSSCSSLREIVVTSRIPEESVPLARAAAEDANVTTVFLFEEQNNKA